MRSILPLSETPDLLALDDEGRAAAQELCDEMSDLSEDGICAAWVSGNERLLWAWLAGEDVASAYPCWGPWRGGEDDRARVRALHEACRGWVSWGGVALVRDDVFFRLRVVRRLPLGPDPLEAGALRPPCGGAPEGADGSLPARPEGPPRETPVARSDEPARGAHQFAPTREAISSLTTEISAARVAAVMGSRE